MADTVWSQIGGLFGGFFHLGALALKPAALCLHVFGTDFLWGRTEHSLVEGNIYFLMAFIICFKNTALIWFCRYKYLKLFCVNILG